MLKERSDLQRGRYSGRQSNAVTIVTILPLLPVARLQVAPGPLVRLFPLGSSGLI